MATADPTFETVGKHKYAIWHWGFKGPVAILADGWESQSGRWRKMVPLLLKAGYQVIALDAPAHGRSSGNQFTMVEYAAAIRFLLQKHAPVSIVIGHSVGASSLIWAMATTSEAVRPGRAVLLAPFSTLRYTLQKSRKALGVIDAVMDAMRHRMVKLFGFGPDEVDLTVKAAQLPEVEAFIIHDKGDKVTAWTESEKIAATWPTAILQVTTGYGHGLTAPEVYKMVEQYIQHSPVRSGTLLKST